MIDELKPLPCPFCGGEPFVSNGDNDPSRTPDGESFRIYCAGCHIHQHYRKTPAKAIAAWNRRAQPEPKRDEVSLLAEIAGAVQAVRAYARANPIHHFGETPQDPNGVHAWLRRNDPAHASQPEPAVLTSEQRARLISSGPNAGRVSKTREPEPAELAESFCFCNEGISLQSVSGGAHALGYAGEVTLNIDGAFVKYRKAGAEPSEEQPCTYKCEAWPDCGCAPSVAPEPVVWQTLLKRLEWSGFNYDHHGDGQNLCPDCEAWQYEGHRPDCELASLLANPPRVPLTESMESLKADLISCRATVKTELHHYERLALVHGKTQLAASYEAEANRLQALLDRIDAIEAAHGIAADRGQG